MLLTHGVSHWFGNPVVRIGRVILFHSLAVWYQPPWSAGLTSLRRLRRATQRTQIERTRTTSQTTQAATPSHLRTRRPGLATSCLCWRMVTVSRLRDKRTRDSMMFWTSTQSSFCLRPLDLDSRVFRQKCTISNLKANTKMIASHVKAWGQCHPYPGWKK